jgi:8-oxo-dGTP pyrophosphatase MutT (NUDIX family)
MNPVSDNGCSQSAAIPFRIEKKAPRVLLITSRRSGRWIVPKGIVEEWQSSKEAALQEAFEEAGVRGTIVGSAVGSYEYEKWGGVCKVKVFLMRVEETLSEWPESDLRDRKWFGIDQALKKVDSRDLRRLIEVASGAMK